LELRKISLEVACLYRAGPFHFTQLVRRDPTGGRTPDIDKLGYDDLEHLAHCFLKEHSHLNESTIERVDRHVAKVQFSKELEQRLRALGGAGSRERSSRASQGLAPAAAGHWLRSLLAQSNPQPQAAQEVF
jgi:hypothetical protein